MELEAGPQGPNNKIMTNHLKRKMSGHLLKIIMLMNGSILQINLEKNLNSHMQSSPII